MQLTSFTDYALRTLIYVGTIEKDELATLGGISNTYKISINHLKKIVHALSKAGYVETRPGRNGGIKLALPPEQISLGAIVRTFEKLEVVECFKEDHSCIISSACHLQHILHETISAALQVLDRYTLADVIGNRFELQGLLHQR